MSAFNFTAQRGLSLLGDEVGAWMADTTAETLVGSELVTNGDFAADTDWTKGDGWGIAAGVASCDGTQTANSNLSQTSVFSSTDDEWFLIEIEITSFTAGNLYILPGGSGANVSPAMAATGKYVFTMQAIGSTAFYMQADSDFVGSIDNVTIRLADFDLSTYENGLGVYGSGLLKSAVADGADLMGYSNFTTLNFLEQPYNDDLDFGTGDFCAMGWFSGSAESVDIILSKSPASSITSPYFELQTIATGELRWIGNAGSSVLDSTQSVAGLLTHVALVRFSGVMYMYINGALNGSAANTDNYDHSNADTLRFGYRQDGFGGVFVGNLSLWKIDAVGRTAAQIKAIYNKEKHLFKKHSYYTQEGVAYDLDLKQMSPRPSDNTQKNVTTTLSGKMRSIVHHEQTEWQINTSVIHRTDNTTYMRKSEFVELMYSTRGSEQFTYDPYGSVASEDEPITVQRVSNRYSLAPEENTEYFRASFTVREVI